MSLPRSISRKARNAGAFFPFASRPPPAPGILRLSATLRTRDSARFTSSAPMAAPAAPASETLELDGKTLRVVSEGKATILVPQGAKIGEDRGEVQQVFYNPIQQYNRDLSVLAIKAYGEEVLERRREKLAEKSGKPGRKRKRDDKDEGDKGDKGGKGGRGAEVEKGDGPPQTRNGIDKTETRDEPKPTDVAPPGEDEGAHARSQFKILDALSASGLRALRYAHEIPFVTSVKANDLSPAAADSIRQNVRHNGLEGIITVTNEDALAHMYRAIADDLSKRDRHGNPATANKFDVIDLDPYGTAAPFFDAAVQAVRNDGGLLCITCTDSAVWAGHSYCEKTFSLYGGTPVKGMHSHEVGLRLILNAVASSAARYGLTIEPLLSLSIDFYTKHFIRVTKSPQAVKFLGAKTMVLYSCDSGCQAWETQFLMRSKPAPNKKGNGAFYKHGPALGPAADRLCRHCGSKMHVNGPMYGGHIHSPDFIRRLLRQIPAASPDVYGTLPRLEGMLRNALEEHIPEPEETEPVDPKEAKFAAVDRYPFFVIPTKLASIVGCQSPTDDMFRGALIHLGYRVGRSHCRAGSIKTDAPWSTIWWIMTEWIRQRSPIKADKFKPLMPGWKILHDAGLLGSDAAAVEAAAGERPEQQPLSNGDGHIRNEGSDDDDAADDDDGVTKMEGLELRNGPGDAPGSREEAAVDGQDAGDEESEEARRKTLIFNDDLARLGRQRDAERLVRYQMNPRADWGPLGKAKAR